MRSLSPQGKSSDSYGAFLTSSVLGKLPVETKKHMACEYANGEWNIEDVMAGIRKEIEVIEMSYQHGGKPSNNDSSLPYRLSAPFPTDYQLLPHSYTQGTNM